MIFTDFQFAHYRYTHFFISLVTYDKPAQFGVFGHSEWRGSVVCSLDLVKADDFRGAASAIASVILPNSIKSRCSITWIKNLTCEANLEGWAKYMMNVSICVVN
jgi:hypothetical protein